MNIISIITPVYNSKKFLNQSISSIINQTYKNFELILVDDGSTDGSSELCDEWASKDSRIKVIHQKNQGQAVARNKALDICTGEYIAFVDSDDYIHPQMFEILLDNLIKSDARISVCNYAKGKLTDYNWGKADKKFEVYSGKDFLAKGLIEKKGKCWLLWDKLYKRDCFEDVRLPEGRIYEDNATVYKLLYKADKVVDCDNVFYYYFTNENSTVNQNFKLKHLDWLIVLEEMILFFEQKNEPELLDWANRCYLNSLADMYNKVKRNCNDAQVQKNIKNKLKSQFDKEKNKYEINIKNYPAVIEILKPHYSKLYWIKESIKNKFRK